MARPPSYEWEVLGEDSDPIPGDPEEVARLGKHLRRTADQIKRQAEEIKALADVDSWKGKAADKYRDQAGDTSEKLRKAFTRYDAAAKAMGTTVREDVHSEYASELYRAQKLAGKALRAAKDADDEVRSRRVAIDKQPKDTPKDDPTLKSLTGKQEAAEADLEHAKKDLQHAKDVRDNAAKAAAEAIRHAIDNDGLKDGGWDKFKDWVGDNADVLEKVADIAGWVATACGVAAMLVGWIPIIGQALAAALGTIAVAATIVGLACHLVLAIAGEGGWFDVALDVVGLATFGIGRAAIAGVKGGAAGVKAATRSSVFRREMAKVAERGVKQGSKTWKHAQQKAWKAARREVEETPRGRAAREAVDNAPKGRFPSWKRVGDAFNPKSIWNDSVDSFKGLKDLRWSNTRQLGDSEAWEGAKFTLKDPDVANAADDLGRVANVSDKSVETARDGFKGQTQLFLGNTAFATGLDGADKAGAFEAIGVK
ncbi:putative T7SS-secreted protein [Streptomyces sp. NPDC042319]|uniref:putative T7SS-secreted protein n=1 Tax=Streptomyces sp. NPDC042319 TaxID=3154332 RepID=UPI00340A4B26